MHRIASAAALLALATAPAHAQLAGRSVSTAVVMLHAEVGVRLNLQIVGDSTARLEVDSAALARGWANAGEARLLVRANHAWYLDVSAATPAWTDGTGHATAKPADDLDVVPVTGVAAAVGTAPRTVASGGRTAGTPLTLRYRARLDAARDRVGTYRMVVRYTLVAR